MASKKQKLSSKAHLPFKVGNKEKRQGLHIRRKKATDSIKRDERFRRRREEDKYVSQCSRTSTKFDEFQNRKTCLVSAGQLTNLGKPIRDPSLRETRLKQNVPLTIERKRVWDDVDSDTGDGLGFSVDVNRVDQTKRRKLEDDQNPLEDHEEVAGSSEDEKDSMIDSASEDDTETPDEPKKESKTPTATARAASPTQSTTSTNLNCTPEALAAKFPTLFSIDSTRTPKILITTGINRTLHKEAELLTNLFPHSVYIPRSSHRYSHRFSVREISSFAANRNFTAVLILKEDLKRISGLDVVHLPAGPTFHFSISVSRSPIFPSWGLRFRDSSRH